MNTAEIKKALAYLEKNSHLINTSTVANLLNLGVREYLDLTTTFPGQDALVEKLTKKQVDSLERVAKIFGATRTDVIAYTDLQTYVLKAEGDGFKEHVKYELARKIGSHLYENGLLQFTESAPFYRDQNDTATCIKITATVITFQPLQ